MTHIAGYNCDKWQTRPLVREGAPHRQTRNCPTVSKTWSGAPDGARHQDGLTDWPSIAMWHTNFHPEDGGSMLLQNVGSTRCHNPEDRNLNKLWSSSFFSLLFCLSVMSKHSQNSTKLHVRVISTRFPIQEVPGSNLATITGYPNWGFSLFFSISTNGCQVPHLKFGHYRFLPHSLQFIIHQSRHTANMRNWKGGPIEHRTLFPNTLKPPYKSEYKATPYFSNEKIRKESFSLTKLNMSFSSEGCEQEEVKTVLLGNNEFKI
jgi:hypothetical protein